MTAILTIETKILLNLILDTSYKIWYKQCLMTDIVHKPKTGFPKILAIAGIALILAFGIWVMDIPTYVASNVLVDTPPFNFAAITLWSTNSPDKSEKTASLPDFETIVIATGIVSATTGEFIETVMFNKNDRGAVQFKIANVGSAPTPEWQFNVKLPTFPFYIYQSEILESLNPNKEKVFTLFFDQITGSPEGTIEINPDPTGEILEIDEKNNIARALIIVTE